MENDVMLEKLQIPQFGEQIIQRNRLLQKMLSYREKAATCIVAPAGYGKTVLAQQFVRNTGLPCLWYQLDSADNDSGQFFQYLTSGFALAIPGFQAEIPQFRLEEAKSENCYERLLPQLIRELEQKAKDGFILVLDDFHFINEPEILNFMEAFLKGLPSGCHTVLLCRYLPDLPLSVLREQGRILDISREELAFSLEETKALFCAEKGLPCTDSILKNIDRSIKGWPLGLFAILLAFENSHPEQFPHTFYKSRIALFHYFLRDVYDSLSQKTQDFLKNTSVLEYLTPQACDFLLGTNDAADILSDLHRRELLIAFNDGRGGVSYRLHAVFREFLLSLVDNPREIFVKAGNYFEEINSPKQAVQFYYSADRPDLMEKAARKVVIPILSQGKIKTVKRWLHYLEEKHCLNSPELILAHDAVSSAGSPDFAQKWKEHAICL